MSKELSIEVTYHELLKEPSTDILSMQQLAALNKEFTVQQLVGFN